jgi:hypothetical protein
VTHNNQVPHHQLPIHQLHMHTRALPLPQPPLPLSGESTPLVEQESDGNSTIAADQNVAL